MSTSSPPSPMSAWRTRYLVVQSNSLTPLLTVYTWKHVCSRQSQRPPSTLATLTRPIRNVFVVTWSPESTAPTNAWRGEWVLAFWLFGALVSPLKRDPPCFVCAHSLRRDDLIPLHFLRAAICPSHRKSVARPGKKAPSVSPTPP